jgi:hypothetical protein
MDAEELFLRTLDHLEQSITSTDEYVVLMSAGLLRPDSANSAAS